MELLLEGLESKVIAGATPSSCGITPFSEASEERGECDCLVTGEGDLNGFDVVSGTNLDVGDAVDNPYISCKPSVTTPMDPPWSLLSVMELLLEGLERKVTAGEAPSSCRRTPCSKAGEGRGEVAIWCKSGDDGCNLH
ncbi:hypothetical protein BHM03_00021135 [Ensete ventricosum]|nr:hypothetical protein BHM03_00021135 [Ensete ventricosum]